jgi:hypothetical protein
MENKTADSLLTPTQRERFRYLQAERIRYLTFLEEAEKLGQPKRIERIYERVHDFSVDINYLLKKNLRRSLTRR